MLQEIEQGPWMENNVDRGSSLLIPTSMNGGCIIVGENKIQYKSSSSSASITIAPTLMKVGKMCMTNIYYYYHVC